MYKILFPFFILGFLSIQAQDVEIKSLKTYNTGNPVSFPLLILNDQNEQTITIEFDVEAEGQPNLSILFRFSDKNWIPYDNAFLANPGNNTAYNLWYDTLPVSANGARYHFNGTFPNFDVTFPFSGKWIYYITDSFDTGKVYASGRFIVVQPEVDLKTELTKEKLQNAPSASNSSNRVFNITVDFDLPGTYFPLLVDEVEIIENFKIDYPVIIKRNTYGDRRYYEWNGASRFSFTARDIQPGNEYRKVNLSDKNRFSPPVTNAQYDGIESSRYYLPGRKDLNGGSRLVDFRNDYAEYMFVNFQLRPHENIKKKIFLTGAFNNWQVLPQYEMYNDNGLYEITVELKRGIYDYQYVTADIFGDEIKNIDWDILEGNYWETGNIYHIFLYYKEDQLGGYDKIIGYQQIFSGDL
ncbi:type IX secretion system plug protein domain-containing protein [Bacteroidota bacterium]